MNPEAGMGFLGCLFVFFFWFTWESDLKCSLALFFLDFWLDPVGWADGARS